MNPKHLEKFAQFNIFTKNFFEELDHQFQKEDIREINILVAFITQSGATQLIQWVRAITDPLIHIKVLTGTYLDFTHPNALKLLNNEKRMNVKVIDTKEEALHAKAIFFEYNSGEGIIYIGSSNLTTSALKSNIEWNVKLSSFVHPEDYSQVKGQFEYLWIEAQEITQSWLTQYKLHFDYSNAFQRIREDREIQRDIPQPRYAQIDALEELKRSRRSGRNKSLVVLATGLGKTHLAAFDSRKFHKVLFVAHVKEILLQAEQIFGDVRRVGLGKQFSEGWYTREVSDVLFATIQKISRSSTLERFNKDEFDYVIIDEFHHAQANSYKKVIEYFEPHFLLGLTATPFRMDRKDITTLCDGNIPYICSLTDAINNEWLCPFKYYGIQDTTVDYQLIPWRARQGYDTKELTKNLNVNRRAQFILEEYRKHPGNPTVGFCVSINHADFMTEFFTKNGVPALAVHSGRTGVEPGTAKSKLTLGDVKVIFAVNVFNEGVDLPEIRKIMLLRPTESMTIFIQQVGRGLRKLEGKTHLTILDFIGNYKKAYTIPAILTGNINPHLGPEVYREILEDQKRKIKDPSYEYQFAFPKDCEIHFELGIINEMIKKLGIIDPIRQSYIRRFRELKENLGYRPNISDMLEQGEFVANYIGAFRSWWNFLRESGELNEFEQGFTKHDVQMLSWLERRPLDTLLSLEIIKYVYKSRDGRIRLEECLNKMERWIGYSEERRTLLQIEVKNNKITEESYLKELILTLVTKKYRNVAPGWHKVEENNEISLEIDSNINWPGYEKEIQSRIQLREEEFKKILTQLHFGALYTKRGVKEYFRAQGASENVDHFFGPRSAGIVRLESIKTLIMFVTIDKHSGFADLQQDYADEIIDQTSMKWESQNITRLESKNGQVITETTQGYRKLMFLRLRAKHKNYGSAFFYLGEVNLKNYQGEKPIQVIWVFQRSIPNEIFEYLSDKQYRKYLPKEAEFIDEFSAYS